VLSDVNNVLNLSYPWGQGFIVNVKKEKGERETKLKKIRNKITVSKL
jgi:hypothetical protein